MKSHHTLRCILASTLLVTLTPLHGQEPPDGIGIRGLQPTSAPETPALNPALERALSTPGLSPDQRRAMRIFHGVWNPDDLDQPADRARAMLQMNDFDDPVWLEESIPAILRAHRLVEIGQCMDALSLLEGEVAPQAHFLRARAFHDLGRIDDADAALEPIITAHNAGRLTSNEDLLSAAQALTLRARLRGEPAARFNEILGITSRIHQEIDRLYWPAKLLEARILSQKDNPQEAAQAIEETLELNPRSAEAYRILAGLHLAHYDFDSAQSIADRLRKWSPGQLDAIILQAEIDLAQSLPDPAQTNVNLVLDRYPRHRHALALAAAVQAVRYDEDGMDIALEALDSVAPNSAQGYYVCGRYLSSERQYEIAARVLSQAIEREPNWPAPNVELGLMYLQSGQDEQALQTLRRVAQLDPFNVRAAFSLHLIESLMTYETVRSDNFIVRFDPETSDRALALEMLEPLEQMHAQVAAAIEHAPDVPTQIELMPNHARFAVRIAGIPELHTIAACTGPVIAMESPRQGPEHFGPYDWKRVLRHEYVHTITLSRTLNRIPHWLTEAAAVWQEQAPRDYSTVSQLAHAYDTGRLFNLDEINWAFIRPKRPGDRGLAYAQGHWMLEYMIERFGHEAFIKLLDEFALGLREEIALPSTLGVSRTQFYEDFLVWAGEQLTQWGFQPTPAFDDLLDEFKQADPAYKQALSDQFTLYWKALSQTMQSTPLGPGRLPEHWLRIVARTPPFIEPEVQFDTDSLARFLDRYPEHPDILRLTIEDMRRTDPLAPDLVPLLHRYAQARPVDPLSDQLLAAIELNRGNRTRAIAHLETLDRFEKYDNSLAVQLARLYRDEQRFDASLEKLDRALTINPFDAGLREEAAAVAIQAQQYNEAQRHLQALIIIEPDRPHHQTRLEALQKLVN